MLRQHDGALLWQEGLLQLRIGRKSFGALPMGKDKALRAEARVPEGTLRRRAIEGGHRVIRHHHHGPGGGEKAPQLRTQVGQQAAADTNLIGMGGADGNGPHSSELLRTADTWRLKRANCSGSRA